MKTRVTIRERQKEPAGVKISKPCSFFLFLLLLTATLYSSIALASPDRITFKSAVVWRSDGKGDYQFDKETFSSPGTYEITPAYETEGQIETITANWKFSGEVTLKVSADNGANYTAIINGLPLTSGFLKGNQLKWRITIGEDSELREIKLAYTDSLGLVGTFGESQLSGFKFRKPIYISRGQSPAGTVPDLFNYQMKIMVAESEGQESADVDCQGNIQADFKDIRFTAADGETLLPYYLESITGDEPDRIAVFWVKIPQIPLEGLPIYMYYSNSDAEDLSNGEDTFDFFDDFSGDDLDLEKWEVKQGSLTVAGLQIKLENAEVLSKDYLIKDGIIEYRARTGAGNEVRLIARSEKDLPLADANQIAYSSGYSGIEHCLAVGDIVKVNQASSLSQGSTYDYRMILDGTNLTFQRYSQGFLDLEAETIYDDQGGLTSGSIGLEVGTDCVSYFEWVRVRKYSPDTIAVDKEAGQLAVAEQVELPDFYGLILSENGNLILEEGYVQGRYTSRTVALADQARIFIPSYAIANASLLSEEAEAISLDVSMDAGGYYATNCLPGSFYYVSKDDFIVGDAWKFKLSLEGSELISPQLSEVSVDYRAGRILLITPNGGETWQVGATEDILWSALEYEESYRMKLEYSLDNGATFNTIDERAKNTGRFSWKVPEDLARSEKAIIKVSDADAPGISAVSYNTFTIIGAGEELPEEKALVIEEAEKLAITDSSKDVVITGDVTISTSSDISFKTLTIGDGTGQRTSRLILYHDIDPTCTAIIIRKGGQLIQANTSEQSISGDLTIESGGILTHLENDEAKLYQINFTAQNIILKSDGLITAQAKGYAGGDVRADGKGKSRGKYKAMCASGGSHGGRGGGTEESELEAEIYGQYREPQDLGSGGAGSFYVKGGRGAGVIKLTAREDFSISGRINADGQDGERSSDNEYDAGGGAAGSIYLQAGRFSGSGAEITAHGGSGYISGGGGGGGRIHIKAPAGKISGTLNANGGPGAKKGFGGSVIVE